MVAPTAEPLALRLLTAGDASAEQSLRVQLGYEVSAAAMAAFIARVLASPNDRAWVTLGPDGDVFGFLHAYGRLALEAPPQVTVQALAVSAPARRTGAGRRLMAAAEAWAAQRGFAFVGLSTQERREEAHRFYEALGYLHSAQSRLYRRALPEH